VKDKIVDLVISVDECADVPWLRCRLFEKCYHLVKVRDLAHGDPGLDVLVTSLSEGESLKQVELTVVKASGFAKGLEVYGLRRYTVEFCEGVDCVAPPGFKF